MRSCQSKPYCEAVGFPSSQPSFPFFIIFIIHSFPAKHKDGFGQKSRSEARYASDLTKKCVPSCRSNNPKGVVCFITQFILSQALLDQFFRIPVNALHQFFAGLFFDHGHCFPQTRSALLYIVGITSHKLCTAAL